MSYQIATIIFLLLCAGMDLRRKQIWWPLTLVYMAAAAAAHFSRGDMSSLNLMGGIAVGAIMLAAAWGTREAIGYGDGLVIAACGAALGFAGILGMVMTALFMAAAWSGVLLLFKRCKRKDCFPFIPFLLAAQICSMFAAA